MATIQTIVRDKLVEHTAQVGALMLDGLRGLQEKYEFIGDVRGKGLMFAVDLVDPATRRPSPISYGE